MSSAAREEDAPVAAAEQLLAERLHLPHEGSYQDPCLNFFLLVDADTSPQRFEQLLDAAWAHDDLTALKLVCNLCVRSAGKERFYASALWMHRNHPRTLAGNLSAFADFGFMEDLPELLYRLVASAAVEEEAPPSAHNDDDTAAVPASPATRSRSRTDHAPAPASPTAAAKKRARTDDDDDSAPASPAVRARTDHDSAAVPVSPATRARTNYAPAPASPTAAAKKRLYSDGNAAARSSRTAATRKRARTDGDDDTATAPAPSSPTPAVVDQVKVDDNVGPLKKAALKYADLAAEMYKSDAKYKLLFDCIAGLFSERLRSDHKHLKDGNPSKIGLTAKCCPRPDSAFDQTTLLSDAIVRSFFSGDSTPPTAVTDIIQDEKGHDLVRDVLAPLALQMQNLPQANKMAKTKLPHEIIQCLGRESDSNANTKNRAVQQWENMVAQVRDKRCLIDSTAICDFYTGGLFDWDNGKPGWVAVALALLISELSCNRWKDKVYPFRDRSDHLRPCNLSNKTLVEKIELLRKMECHSNLSLRKVFEAILKATKGRTPQIRAEDLVKTVFVFSYRDFDQAIEAPGPIMDDEHFDSALPRPWRDDYDIMIDKFIKAGYGECMPQVVFWNLCGQRSAALTSIKDGVIHLSGYSDDLLMLFLEKSGVVYPENEMSAAIAGEEYHKLKVLS